MKTSVAPKNLFAFIIESSKRSFLLAWIAIVNAFTGAKYVLVMEEGRFVSKKDTTQSIHPSPFYNSQRYSVASDKI